MILGLDWVDIVIVAIVIIASVKGFLRGFVSELGGAVALAASLITPWYYNGAFDPWLTSQVHIEQGSAHVVGMFLTGFITYFIVLGIAWVLNRFAKLPILNIGNSAGGAIIGFLKGAFLIWLALYIALFFPLTPDIRKDLHESRFASSFTQPNNTVDSAVEATIPWFARPFLNPFFKRHHV